MVLAVFSVGTELVVVGDSGNGVRKGQAGDNQVSHVFCKIQRSHPRLSFILGNVAGWFIIYSGGRLRSRKSG